MGMFKQYLAELLTTGSMAPQTSGNPNQQAQPSPNPQQMQQQQQQTTVQDTQKMARNAQVDQQLQSKRGNLVRLQDQLGKLQKQVLDAQREVERLEMQKVI